jgi:hypothetical protein
MIQVRRRKASAREPTSGNKRRRGHSSGQNKRSLADGLLDAWAVNAERERLKWLDRPRLHTAVFEQARRDEEIERLLATNGAAFKDKKDEQVFVQQKEKRKQEINAAIGSLGWPSERLESFIDAVVSYRRDASIQNYLFIREKFPEVEIQVPRF